MTQPQNYQYVFGYMTPPVPPAEGNPIPTQFAISGISDEVAHGIIDGLQTVVSITDVTLTKVTAVTEEIPV